MRAIQAPRVSYKAAGKPQPVFDNDTGKCIGHIMPSVHPDVLRASPGIQGWSQPATDDQGSGEESTATPGAQENTAQPPHDSKRCCYQCEAEVPYLFDDCRCKDCTRLTPDEIVGNVDEKSLEELTYCSAMMHVEKTGKAHSILRDPSCGYMTCRPYGEEPDGFDVVGVIDPFGRRYSLEEYEAQISIGTDMSEEITCSACGSEQERAEAFLGALGSLEHYRCRYCGIGWHE